MFSRLIANNGKVNVFDFMLVAVAALTAVYSGGQAVIVNIVSILGVVGVLLGITMSYLFRRLLEGSKLLTLDWIPYTVVMVCCVVFVRELNSAFPEETFPRELMPSSWLFWMLTLGSFFVWSDRTLLFHAIPALAMFGFVACYDTFRPVIFFFFIYLICFATLFARAHARDMQQRAIRSGFFANDPASIEQPERQIVQLREGPWRWAAGPEWALWSALGIVLLSLLGAPVIRFTVKPIAGVIRLVNPVSARAFANATTSGSNMTQTAQKVGNGPISLTDTPAFDVSSTDGQLDSQTPYRTRVYDRYKDHSWEFVWDNASEYLDEQGVYVAKGYDLVMKLNNPKKQVISVNAMRPTQEVLQRGMEATVISQDLKSTRSERSDTLMLVNPISYTALQVQYEVPANISEKSSAPTILGGNLKAALDTSNFRASVAEQARKIAGKGSDYEKAERIRAYIASTVVYNTKAKACPTDKDPVEWVLFENKEGYCDLYASAMVQMARVIGIPARYAVGFLPNPKNLTENGHQILTDADRHAWAELFFQGSGWVVFDATEGAREVPGGERASKTGPGFSLPIIPMLIGMAVIIAAVGVVSFMWSKKEAKPEVQAKKEMDKVVIEFVALLWKCSGRRRQLGETLVEYITATTPKLEHATPETLDQIRQFGIRFSNTLYGPEPPLPEEVAEFKTDLVALKKALKQKPAKPASAA